jgi:hypothetical protein
VHSLPVIWSEEIYIIIVVVAAAAAVFVVVVVVHSIHGVRNVYKFLLDNLSHKTETSAKTEI